MHKAGQKTDRRANEDSLDSLRLLVGLGNPGEKYKNTPHNVGFYVIDVLANLYSCAFQNKFEGLLTEFSFPSQEKNSEKRTSEKKIFLFKPTTWMNHSGQAIQQIQQFYQLFPSQILVISDDLDLPLGSIRIRKTGGHGGHNGLRSVIDCLGSKDFIRLRMGIGRHSSLPPDVYVLKKILSQEQPFFEEMAKKAVEAIKTILQLGVDIAMNQFNVTSPPLKKTLDQPLGDKKR